MKYIDELEEVRNEYVVTSKMKKVWKKQMELLDNLDRICHKYGIKYFADSGTLIGAIRHKGYIPWDDDIDIVMKRADYNKFLEIAPKEFKKPIFVQTIYNDDGYFRTHAQMRNSNTTAILESEKDFNYKFNQGIFIDIFPLDEIPDNALLFKLQVFRLKVLKFIILFGYQKNKIESGKKIKNIILKTRIIPIICKWIVKIFGIKKIFKKFEKIASKYNGKGNKRISYLALSLGMKKNLWNISCFSSVERVKFENMMIDIPSGYDERLKTEYGDYMVFKKEQPTSHGGIIFDPEKSYIEYLSEEEISYEKK